MSLMLMITQLFGQGVQLLLMLAGARKLPCFVPCKAPTNIAVPL